MAIKFLLRPSAVSRFVTASLYPLEKLRSALQIPLRLIENENLRVDLSLDQTKL